MSDLSAIDVPIGGSITLLTHLVPGAWCTVNARGRFVLNEVAAGLMPEEAEAVRVGGCYSEPQVVGWRGDHPVRAPATCKAILLVSLRASEARSYPNSRPLLRLRSGRIAINASGRRGFGHSVTAHERPVYAGRGIVQLGKHTCWAGRETEE